MKNCIFCDIIKKKISSVIIYEDDKTFAFLDIAPASAKGGHTLVMTKNHYELISEVKDEDIEALMITIRKVSKALLEFGEGMNLVQNNKKVAGQLVPHIHFHLIPRFKNDGIRIEKWSNNKYNNKKEMEETADKIKSLLK